MSLMSLLVKVIVSAIALAIATFLTPGMSNSQGFGTTIIAAVVIGLLNWAADKFLHTEDSPAGRGLTGFIISVAILLIAGRLVDGFNVNLLGAIVGSLILGIVDAIIPGEQFKF